jgi:peptide/nickel transport system permease protein
VLFAVAWLAFWAVAVGSRAEVSEVLHGGGGGGLMSAVVFLALALIGIPVASTVDCRRIRSLESASDSEATAGTSRARIAYRRFMRNRIARTGLFLVLTLYCVAILAPLLAPHDPNAQEDIVRTRFLSPRQDHPMGTDKFGRDILSRVIYGSRISLSIGFVAVTLAITLGLFFGCIAGYFGDRVDWVVMRVVDVLIAFPKLFIILTLIAIYSPKIWLIVAVLGLTGWMGVARLVRGQILSLREQEFVEATRALGIPAHRTILRHLLPNTLSPVIVAATLMIGDVILVEAVLSFLGLGVQPPTASWGNIINQGRDNLLGAWWISTFPGLAIVLTVVSYNLLGDGLRDALDPRTRPDGVE